VKKGINKQYLKQYVCPICGDVHRVEGQKSNNIMSVFEKCHKCEGRKMKLTKEQIEILLKHQNEPAKARITLNLSNEEISEILFTLKMIEKINEHIDDDEIIKKIEKMYYKQRYGGKPKRIEWRNNHKIVCPHCQKNSYVLNYFSTGLNNITGTCYECGYEQNTNDEVVTKGEVDN